MFGSLRSSTANKSRSPPPPVVPSAFAAKKNMFAPPPARRTPSTSSDSPTNSHAPPPPPPPRRPPTPEEEPQGEWAEVLYDYTSEVKHQRTLLLSVIYTKRPRVRRILLTSRFKLNKESSLRRERQLIGMHDLGSLLYHVSLSSPRWTGEVDGRTGIFPASYVKLL